MTRLKAFFITFTLTFSIMLICFVVLYWSVQYSSPQPAGETQQGVPILSITPEDTKTVLTVIDFDKTDFYFLIQFNAIQNKINVVSVPGGCYLSSAQRTLAESMDYAGVRQCVQDLSRQFDIAIDYYLVTDGEGAVALTDSFGAADMQQTEIPQPIQQYIAENSRYIDVNTLVAAVEKSYALLNNDTGIKFLNTAITEIIKANIDKLKDDLPQNIKDNYSLFNTDIGTQGLDRLKRIVKILGSAEIEFGNAVVTDADGAQKDIDSLMK